MNISMGIVGLPNVGKSTLFNALTNKAVSAENYPFCTIDPSVGIVPVPDGRLETLADLSHSENSIPAVVEFVDIAGLVKGASEGEGLGNKFLANIREVDAMAHVVRIFEDPDITHVHGTVDPLHDIEIINTELVLADMETVRKHREKLQKDIKRNDKEAIHADSVLQKVEERLGETVLVSEMSLADDELEVVDRLHLLTAKKMLYVLNKMVGSKNIDDLDDGRWEKLFAYLEERGGRFVVVDAALEGELREMGEEERRAFREDAGIEPDGGLNHLIVASYDLLGLMTYFTTGEKETRAWTVEKGSTAPDAAAAIHTDFREKFIRAEVIAYEHFVEAGSKSAARDKGWLRIEGKDYIVQEGDILEFRI